ncbi:uncharacterized protein METZ01_LOCUS420260, partial [marine metagenome]
RACLACRRRRRPHSRSHGHRGGLHLARQAQADLHAPHGHRGPRRHRQRRQGRADGCQDHRQDGLRPLRLPGRPQVPCLRWPALRALRRGRASDHPGHAPEEPTWSTDDHEAQGLPWPGAPPRGPAAPTARDRARPGPHLV